MENLEKGFKLIQYFCNISSCLSYNYYIQLKNANDSFDGYNYISVDNDAAYVFSDYNKNRRQMRYYGYTANTGNSLSVASFKLAPE